MAHLKSMSRLLQHFWITTRIFSISYTALAQPAFCVHLRNLPTHACSMSCPFLMLFHIFFYKLTALRPLHSEYATIPENGFRRRVAHERHICSAEYKINYVKGYSSPWMRYCVVEILAADVSKEPNTLRVLDQWKWRHFLSSELREERTYGDFRLPPRRRWNLQTSGSLRSE